MAVTLRQVAEKCGYAVSTVSHVLNKNPSCYASQETREAILKAANSLGYRPNFFARALRYRKTNIVGVASSLFGHESDPQALQQVRQNLARQGYMAFFMEIGPAKKDLPAVIEDLARLSAEGIILFAEGPMVEGLVRELALQVPLVLITASKVDAVPALLIDHHDPIRQLVGNFAEAGHSRLAFCTRDPKSDSAKIASFEESASEFALDWDVVEFPGEFSTDFDPEQLNILNDFSGVLASHDHLAAAIIRCLLESGRQVPQDCAVAGFGDTDIARLLTPQLTTIRPPREEVGTMAVEMLVERMAGRSVEGRVLVPELVERGSTSVLAEISTSV